MEDLLQGITWLGHDSFKIQTPEVVIYIDPWKLKDGESRLTNSGTEYQPSRGWTENQPADLILITHVHHDHFSPDDVKKIQKADTIIVSVADVTAQVKGNVKTVKPGDKLTVKGIEIEAVPAYNPDKQFHPKAAGHVGFVITIAGRRIYHAGDTDFIPEMANIKADVALLPVGGKYTMNAQEAAQAANIIKPRVAVPMHWGGVIGSSADAEEFRALAKVPVEILKPQ